jgi:hypothetical protein
MPLTMTSPRPPALTNARGDADGHHQGGAQPREDRRHRELELDPAQHLASRHPHAAGGLDQRGIHLLNANDGVSQHGKQA